MIVTITLFALYHYYRFMILKERLLNNEYPKKTKASRLTVMEFAYLGEKINYARSEVAINAVIKDVGMGGVKFGHLKWAYSQINSTGPINLSTLPGKSGL